MTFKLSAYGDLPDNVINLADYRESPLPSRNPSGELAPTLVKIALAAGLLYAAYRIHQGEGGDVGGYLDRLAREPW